MFLFFLSKLTTGSIIFFFIFFFPHVAFAQQTHIVVTVPYLKDLIQNITCSSSSYQVLSLIPVGVDPHTFLLAPEGRINLKNADLVVKIGAGLEPWLDKLTNGKQKYVNLSQYLDLRPADPHIWQSPTMTKDATLALSQILARLSPQDKNKIERCTKSYIKEINSTVAQLKIELSTIPPQNKIIATNHESLGYFADAFGFKVFSILGVSDEEEPTFQQLKNLITLLQQQQIKSVFLESTGNRKNIETVAYNAHIKIGGKLYGDSFGEPSSGADTTLGLWQTNVSTLVKALK
jgi:zinc/manganese transport system substrate-binding protein